MLNMCAFIFTKSMVIGVKSCICTYFLHDLNNCEKCQHIYFPDPWPKARQQKRRIFRNKDFLTAITRTLTLGGGKLSVATDYAEYFSEIQERLSELKELKPVPLISSGYQHIDTNFETKYRLEGRKIYRAVYEKV